MFWDYILHTGQLFYHLTNSIKAPQDGKSIEECIRNMLNNLSSNTVMTTSVIWQYLDENSLTKSCTHKGLGHPASGIRCRPVNLGEVLAGERASTVGTPTSVCVHDDFTTGQTSITLLTVRQHRPCSKQTIVNAF